MIITEPSNGLQIEDAKIVALTAVGPVGIQPTSLSDIDYIIFERGSGGGYGFATRSPNNRMPLFTAAQEQRVPVLAVPQGRVPPSSHRLDKETQRLYHTLGIVYLDSAAWGQAEVIASRIVRTHRSNQGNREEVIGALVREFCGRRVVRLDSPKWQYTDE